MRVTPRYCTPRVLDNRTYARPVTQVGGQSMSRTRRVYTHGGHEYVHIAQVYCRVYRDTLGFATVFLQNDDNITKERVYAK